MEAALHELLASNVDVAAIVGDRIYPAPAEGIQTPLVTYEVLGAEDTFTRSGYTGLYERRVVLNCVGRTYDDAPALAAAVKAALPLWGTTIATTVGTVQFRMIRRDDERDYLANEEGTITPAGRQLDFTIKFSTEEPE